MTKKRPQTHVTPANTPDQPAAGKGMPARTPQPQTTPPGGQPTFEDGSIENTLELPHDRDQAVDMTGGEQSVPLMEQAAKDIEDGRKDTSKQPEMNQAYQKQR
ncbi:MAG: hypothetical protein M3R45_07010 [Pseudomonadota bacterium]|nr:hypothetical protein [Pseudomonadota bacterium]